MLKCEFCGSEISEQASFCGQCGNVPGKMIEGQTSGSGFQVPQVSDMDTATSISAPGNPAPQWYTNQPPPNIDAPTMYLSEEEEEEERRRRAAMLGMGIPLFGDMLEGQPYAANVPMVQGTPQIAGVPTVQGTPQLGSPPPGYAGSHMPAGFMGEGFHSSPTVMAPHAPSTITTPHPPHPGPRGCGPIFLIAAITIPVLLILSSIGLAFTLFAPGLSLSGSSDVSQGGTFTLLGSRFFPGSNVTLTLDDTIPLYVTDRTSPVQFAYAANASLQVLGTSTQQATQAPPSSNVVSAGGDGTFSVTITVSTSWPIGKHTIKATESFSHRGAQLDITIHLPGTSPSTTETASPSPSATIITSATTTSGLSCVEPSSLALGPVSQGYSQPVSSVVTLCTTGTGAVNWTASWNQGVAPWLQLDHTSGQISAPGQAQVNVSALASNLGPGSYSVTVTFSSQVNSVTESLSVSFTVQAGCIHGTPGALKFTGTANLSDPSTQAVTITNCGSLGTWSATTQTYNGANWLFTNPTSNTLNAGATASVTITASNLKGHLAAGTYTGTVIFRIGLGSFSVGVTLTVMSAPILSGTPTSIYANQQCKLNSSGAWICYVSLTNNSNTLNLNWSSTSSGLKGVSFKPASSTLLPGQTILVQITVPQSNCPTKSAALLFTGPANTVNVSWYCIVG